MGSPAIEAVPICPCEGVCSDVSALDDVFRYPKEDFRVVLGLRQLDRKEVSASQKRVEDSLESKSFLKADACL